jgi:hypothetical protein
LVNLNNEECNYPKCVDGISSDRSHDEVYCFAKTRNVGLLKQEQNNQSMKEQAVNARAGLGDADFRINSYYWDGFWF